MSPLPPSTHEIIAQAHRITSTFGARMRLAMEELPGNPGQVTVARFGSLWATRCDLQDSPSWMNMLGPLSAADLGVLGDALAWYAPRRPLIEVTPQPRHDELARALARAGAVQTGMLDILRGPLPALGNTDRLVSQHNVTVSPVEPDEAMLFARTLLGGHAEQFTDDEARGLANVAVSDWVRTYLARVDGEPAAAAMLTFEEGIGYLANASALPAFRARGCHSALIATRVHDAVAAGCDVILGLAEVGSISHRNMERAGLHPLVTIGQWSFPPPD